ncbi:CHRD domain-containing protein [Opitutus terrae]|uniref:CHRD domain containing protein n=1 Tax=Opitutus terrae (strain DSM 11246 / JCM 15787 / PB90-1) TaxID=452637 RepID=B1ZX53_OPITP|nr:CHRD domain-containing protein [Opitutus terrae]ACB76105.1 CHRD domain containing protein [Opitutus terrae PB90-1]
MNNTRFLGFRLLGALGALSLVPVSAQIVELRATINAQQETTASASPATGTAVMLYDVATNKFDLTVTIENFANPITNSHIHEGAVGVAGGVVTGLGAEAVYQRSGNTVTATFAGVTHGGSPATLLSGGAYYNVHSATYPGGEVRGQLLPQPVKLVAVLDGAHESTPNTSTAVGAALITFQPDTKKITTRINVYRFTNPLTNSHYHEADPGTAGGVVHGLGGASVYTRTGDSYGAVFADQTYGGDTVKLLAGGAYLNVHSDVYPGGEIRGQVQVSNRTTESRLVNVSNRGWVGTGDQVLITGFVIEGGEPLRVLVTARGQSLAAAGVTGVLADPMVSLHDAQSRQLLTNDKFTETFGAGELPAIGYGPSNLDEAALLVILPPGAYTAITSGVGGTTGIAISEAYEVQP